MSNHDEKLKQVALFRFSVIDDLIHLPRGSTKIAQLLRAKAERTYIIPNSNRCFVAAETMRGWLSMYRRGGFDALCPRVRNDRGVSHTLPREVIDLVCQMKDDDPALSVPQLIKKIREENSVPAELPLPRSTVHRLLSRAGLIRKATPRAKDHRRFSFEHANDLWMSDVMHGPTVAVIGKQRRKAYLIAFIDDATRLVPFAAFTLSENATTFLPQLKEAITRRGIPKRLYVDNGAAFRSHHLELVCAKLGITLIHARPYAPEGKGKQERWFRSVRMQFLPTLRPEDTESLQAINRRLRAWIEGEYHHAPHRGLGNGLTPLDAWAARAADVDHVGGRADIEDMFLFEEKRKVAKDRTVSLNGTAYEVDAILVNTTVVLRFDPERVHHSLQVWDKNGVRFADAKPVDIYANSRVKRTTSDVVDADKNRASLVSLRFRDLEGSAI